MPQLQVIRRTPKQPKRDALSTFSEMLSMALLVKRSNINAATAKAEQDLYGARARLAELQRESGEAELTEYTRPEAVEARLAGLKAKTAKSESEIQAFTTAGVLAKEQRNPLNIELRKTGTEATIAKNKSERTLAEEISDPFYTELRKQRAQLDIDKTTEAKNLLGQQAFETEQRALGIKQETQQAINLEATKLAQEKAKLSDAEVAADNLRYQQNVKKNLSPAQWTEYTNIVQELAIVAARAKKGKTDYVEGELTPGVESSMSEMFKRKQELELEAAQKMGKENFDLSNLSQKDQGLIKSKNEILDKFSFDRGILDAKGRTLRQKAKALRVLFLLDNGQNLRKILTRMKFDDIHPDDYGMLKDAEYEKKTRHLTGDIPSLGRAFMPNPRGGAR